MGLDWLPGTLERVVLGAVGGASAYWLSRRRFLTERQWERRYELFCQLFETLNEVEHSLVLLQSALAGGIDTRRSAEARTAAESYEAALLRLNQYQERLMMLGLQQAHEKVMVLNVGLRLLSPHTITGAGALEAGVYDDLDGLLKGLRREAAGRNGELAFLARRYLRMEPGRGSFKRPTEAWRRWRAKRAGRRRPDSAHGACAGMEPRPWQLIPVLAGVMKVKPSRAVLMEAYLELGCRKKSHPGTEYQRVVDLVGADAAADEAKALDAVLASIVCVPEVRDAPSLAEVGARATSRAKVLYPDFSDPLCEEIGQYASFQWR